MKSKENSQTSGFTPQRTRKEDNIKLKGIIKEDKAMIRAEVNDVETIKITEI